MWHGVCSTPRAMKRALLLSLTALSSLGCSAESSDSSRGTELPIGTVTSALSSTVEPVASFGSNPGELKLYAYVPKPLPANAPLVLVLHGCTQGAMDAAKWGWNELADQYGFVVGYPEQQTANNSMRCFNWGGEYGNLDNLTRGKGENESIKEMVDALVGTNGLDPKRVFIAGFSDGGGTALVAAATWPEVFSGVASLSGIPYKCNANYSEVFTCMNPGVDRPAQDWGDRVRNAYPGYTGAYPRVSIWQGSADTTIGLKNRTQIIRQWTNVHGLPETATDTSTVDGAKRETFKSATGEILLEAYEVPGMNHGVAVAPSAQCGTASANAFDKGICQALRVIEFFGLTGTAPVEPTDGGVTPGADAGTKPPSGNTPPTGGPASTTPPGATNGAAGAKTESGFKDNRSPGSTCSAAPIGAAGTSSAGLLAAFGLAVLALFRKRAAR